MRTWPPPSTEPRATRTISTTCCWMSGRDGAVWMYALGEGRGLRGGGSRLPVWGSGEPKGSGEEGIRRRGGWRTQYGTAHRVLRRVCVCRLRALLLTCVAELLRT